MEKKFLLQSSFKMNRRNAIGCNSIEAEELKEDPEVQLEKIGASMAHIARFIGNIKKDLNPENATNALNGHDDVADTLAVQAVMGVIHDVERHLKIELAKTDDMLQMQKLLLKKIDAVSTTDENIGMLNAVKSGLIQLKSEIKSVVMDLSKLEIRVLHRIFSSFIPKQEEMVQKFRVIIHGVKDIFKILFENSELALKKVEKLSAGATGAASVADAAGCVGDSTG